MRVFLHDILWREDPEAFLGRIDRFLDMADGHGISVMLVLFDGVWNPYPAPGPQPAPIPHVHNSQWVQWPGAEILGHLERHDELEASPTAYGWGLAGEGEWGSLATLTGLSPWGARRAGAACT